MLKIHYSSSITALAPTNYTLLFGFICQYVMQMPTPSRASKVLTRSILLEPEEGPDKYLYMAQLHEGREALGHYEKGLELLQKKLADGADRTKEEEVALRQRVCMAYCSIGELFLTDLCFDEDAETRCQVRFAFDATKNCDYPPVVANTPNEICPPTTLKHCC